MLAAQRREYLLEALHRNGKIVAKDVAADLGLSEDSIRRDLRELAAEGRCQRVYGGALPVSPAIADYAGRSTVSVSGKQQVAAAAVTLIRPGATVIIDGGTTALALARALPPSLACTVITHSPTVAAALVEHPAAEVLILGGKLFKHSAVACGAAAMEAAHQVWADVFFMGVTGVHPDAGLTTGDADEAAMKRALASRAAETYVLASSEKIGTASPYQVIPLGQASAIITDTPPESVTVQELCARQVQVITTSGPVLNGREERLGAIASLDERLFWPQTARRLAPPHIDDIGGGGSSGIGGGCGAPNAASAADMAP